MVIIFNFVNVLNMSNSFIMQYFRNYLCFIFLRNCLCFTLKFRRVCSCLIFFFTITREIILITSLHLYVIVLLISTSKKDFKKWTSICQPYLRHMRFSLMFKAIFIIWGLLRKTIKNWKAYTLPSHSKSLQFSNQVSLKLFLFLKVGEEQSI